MVNKPDWFARALQALCMFCAKLKLELEVLIPGMKHCFFFCEGGMKH
jgi:hypothetical protein